MEEAKSYEEIARRLTRIISEEMKGLKVKTIPEEEQNNSLKITIDIVGKILMKEKGKRGEEIPRIELRFHHKKKKRLMEKGWLSKVSKTAFFHVRSQKREKILNISDYPPNNTKENKSLTSFWSWFLDVIGVKFKQNQVKERESYEVQGQIEEEIERLS